MRRFMIAVLALASLASGAIRANEVKATVEKVEQSIVQVSFSQVNENGSKTRHKCIGTVVNKDGLVVFSADYMPRSVPDNRFVDFKVKFVNAKEQPEIPAEFLVRDSDLSSAVARVSKEKDVPAGLVVPIPNGKDLKLERGMELMSFGLLPDSYGSTVSFATGRLVKVVKEPQRLLLIHRELSIDLYAPVTTSDGVVIGFVVQDPLYRRGASGRTYVALPVSRIMELINRPRKKRTRSWLGVSHLQPVTRDISIVLGLPENRGGVIVGRVLDGMPAWKGGLRVEDVILKLDDELIQVRTETELSAFLERLKLLKIGQDVKLTVFRTGKEQVLDIKMGERPKNVSKAQHFEDKDLGLIVRELVYYDLLGRDLRASFTGLMVHYVKSGSWPDLAGMRKGDIITKIDERELSGKGEKAIEQFKAIVADLKKRKKKEFVIFVSRGRKGQDAAFIKIDADWK